MFNVSQKNGSTINRFLMVIALLLKTTVMFPIRLVQAGYKKYPVPMKVLVISFLATSAVIVIAHGMPQAKADDWANVTAAIAGAVSIMPSIGDLIGAVLPVILKLAIYSFIIGLFGALLVAIKEAMSWGK